MASANLPALLYNLFWKRFNTMGATFSIYCGLIMAVLLVTFSPGCVRHTYVAGPECELRLVPAA